MKKIVYSLIGLVVFGAISCSSDYTKTDLNDDFSTEKIADLARFPEAAMNFTNSLAAGTNNAMITFGIANVDIHEDFGQKAVDIIMDVMGTDIVFPSSNFFVFQYNYTAMVESSGRSALTYNYYGKLAHNANLIIQFAQSAIHDYTNSEIYARALALRGFANFNQMRMLAWGDMGVNYETVDEEGNLILFNNRVDSNTVYQFIENDFLTAYNILQGGSNGGDRQIIDGKTAAGFLARYYMFQKDWAKAQDYASKALGGQIKANDFDAINKDGFSVLNNVDNMWGIDINGSNTTSYASYFSHMDALNIGYANYSRTPKLFDARLAAQIAPGDKRRAWVYNGTDTIINYRGETLTGLLPEYTGIKMIDKSAMQGDYIFMRSSEMMLNYIESAFENGDVGAAKSALEEFMATRLPGYSAASLSGNALREEIRVQRRIELWGEGFGLFDIRRWEIPLDRATPFVMKDGTVVESNHGAIPDTKVIYPVGYDKFRFQFPRSEINANLELRPQNP